MDRGGTGFAQAMHPPHAPSTCSPRDRRGSGLTQATHPHDRGGTGLAEAQATHLPHTARHAARDNDDTVQQCKDLNPISDPSFEDRSGLTLVSRTVSGPTLNESAILLKCQIPVNELLY